jgi:hypothetical protein
LDYFFGGRKEWLILGKDLIHSNKTFGSLLKIVFLKMLFGLFELFDKLIFAPIACLLKNVLDLLEQVTKSFLDSA